MSELIISEQHSHAVELHQKILISASLAQQNLWDMCTSLKKMRDGKLYKEFGYQNFEDYCESEIGFSRMQAHKYISIIENVKNVNSSLHFGVTKLALLATISEQEQAEISEKINLEETTVKELKAEIDRLKAKNEEISERSIDYCKRLNEAKREADNSSESLRDITAKFNAERDKNFELNNKVKELESRPIEVAVVDNSEENERKIKEAVEMLEQQSRQREAYLESKFRAEQEDIRKKFEKEKQYAISEVRSDYERKLAENSAAEMSKPEPVDEDKFKFKVYLTSAYDMLTRLTEFTLQHSEQIYKEKIKQLLNSVLAGLEE